MKLKFCKTGRRKLKILIIRGEPSHCFQYLKYRIAKGSVPSFSISLIALQS